MGWDWWTYRCQPRKFVEEVKKTMAAEATALKMARKQ